MNMKKHNATRPACGFSVLRVHVLKLKIEDFLVKCGSGNVIKWIQLLTKTTVKAVIQATFSDIALDYRPTTHSS